MQFGFLTERSALGITFTWTQSLFLTTFFNLVLAVFKLWYVQYLVPFKNDPSLTILSVIQAKNLLQLVCVPSRTVGSWHKWRKYFSINCRTVSIFILRSWRSEASRRRHFLTVLRLLKNLLVEKCRIILYFHWRRFDKIFVCK